MERRDWLLNNRPVVYVRGLSYALYLCQQPFLDDRVHRYWTSFPLNVSLAVSAALAMHYLVERPMLALGKRLSSGRLNGSADEEKDRGGADVLGAEVFEGGGVEAL